MSAMITQKKFLKLGKIGPNTLKVVFATTTNTRDKSSTPRSSLYSLFIHNRISNRLLRQSYNLL